MADSEHPGYRDRAGPPYKRLRIEWFALIKRVLMWPGIVVAALATVYSGIVWISSCEARSVRRDNAFCHETCEAIGLRPLEPIGAGCENGLTCRCADHGRIVAFEKKDNVYRCVTPKSDAGE